MRIDKIDKRLLEQISALSLDHEVFCFVKSSNLQESRRHLAELDIHILDEYLFIKTFYCCGTHRKILRLLDKKETVYISSNPTASSLMFVSRKILGVDDIKLTGRGVGVAFIDTGVSFHPDFCVGKNRLSFFMDLINNKHDFYDDNGHGTFVCGVCSGNGAMSSGKYCGIAPQSEIFSLKALNENGESSANRILNAMQWIYDNHEKRGIKVVCMSFGSEPLGENDPIMIGADALWDDGVVVVSAAGNSGPAYQTIKSPGISRKIITVGGIDDNRFDNENYNANYFEIADFSSRGPSFRAVKPDVVAPSVDVVSCGTLTPYRVLSGTSVATPMIAGLCALMLEKQKYLSPNEIKKRLTKICQPLGFDVNFEGKGLPNFKKYIT
ncbi:MAG: S8 family peptidase [Clostridia bacterium]|nr:S8 family peptidase [Clostridia bacterium]